MARIERAECKACGAPLPTTARRGRIICEYCGAQYFADGSFKESGEHEPVVQPLPKPTLTAPSPAPVTPPIRRRKQSSVAAAIIGFGAFLLIVLMIRLLSGNSSTSETSRNRGTPIPKMVASLPLSMKAGQKIAYKGWELGVNSSFSTYRNKLHFEMEIKNWAETDKVFRFQAQDIVVYDDLGNIYPMEEGSCSPAALYSNLQITVSPRRNISLKSSSSWCKNSPSIPAFSGVIPVNAKKLYIKLERFDVFDGLIIVFDL